MTTSTRRNGHVTWAAIGAARYQRTSRVPGNTWGLDSWSLEYPSPFPGYRSPNVRSRTAQRVLDIRAGGAGRFVARPLVWHGLIRFSSDRIHKAAVEVLARGFHFSPYDQDETASSGDLHHSRSFQSAGGKDRVEGRLGFRRPLTDRERELLKDQRSQLIKLQFALWARAFAETDGDPSRPAVVTLSQLCEDLGYRRLQNGAHRPEHKRQVAEWVELLTSVWMNGTYRAPDGRQSHLAGPLWRRFLDWEGERSIAFAPGSWYADPVWRQHNQRVGLIGAGLLSLRPDRDRWAISVGAYLASLARMNGYRPLTLRVTTLIERTGLQDAEQRNPSRMREMLERALEQLETSGVIGEWDWFHTDPTEPDMDAPADLLRLAADGAHWTERSLVIQWPVRLRDREVALRSSREAQTSVRRATRTRAVPKR